MIKICSWKVNIKVLWILSFLFLFVCVREREREYVNTCANVHVGTCECQKSTSDTLEMKLQVFVYYQIWVLGSELCYAWLCS